MSIPVGLDDLAAAIEERAGFAYLLTVSDDARPHAVAVVPRLAAAALVCDAGNRSCANSRARPDVALVWPPRAAGDYSLIVDGRASVDGSTVTVAPERAVLHRPAPGGGSDCAPVPLGAPPA